MTLEERAELSAKVLASISAIAPHARMTAGEWNDAVEALYQAANQIYEDGLAQERAVAARDR